MSNCSNCFNNCSEITSDKCVKYTGVDIPILGIKNGDSLSYIEQTLMGFLTSVIDGTGIKIDIPPETYCQPTACTIVSNYLPTCGDITIVDLFVAVIRAACDLQTQIDAINDELIALNTDYTLPVDCFPTDLLPADDTHIIIQAVINKLCSTNTNLIALSNELHTNYATIGPQLNSIIQAYLNSVSVGGLMSSKMVPFTVVEYYGDLTNYPVGLNGFGPDGIGYGAWLNVFLCNGANGTPDKRGRVGVGCTNTPGLISMDSAVLPGGFNPTYTLFSKTGTNSITLSESQMPTHIHTAPSVVTNDSHFHFQYNTDVGSEDTGATSLTSTVYPNYKADTTDANDFRYLTTGSFISPTIGRTSSTTTNIIVTTTVGPKGSSSAHNNIQPGMGCYYIMFIP